jgi:hypothetical protein
MMVIFHAPLREEVKHMEDDLGRTPLTHLEDCDCCCGCDSSVEREDHPKNEDGEPRYRPL